MRDLALSIEFWVAMAFAVVLKLRASPTITIGGAIMTTIAAVGAALIGTEPVLQWLQVDRDVYTPAVAALLALTGEHVARQIMAMNLGELMKLGGKR